MPDGFGLLTARKRPRATGLRQADQFNEAREFLRETTAQNFAELGRLAGRRSAAGRKAIINAGRRGRVWPRFQRELPKHKSRSDWRNIGRVDLPVGKQTDHAILFRSPGAVMQQLVK